MLHSALFSFLLVSLLACSHTRSQHLTSPWQKSLSQASHKAQSSLSENNSFFKAHSAQLKGNYAEAEAFYQQLLSRKAEDSFLLQRYGESLLQQEKFTEAESVYAKLYQKAPRHQKTGLVLGQIYSFNKNEAAARQVYHRLLQQHVQEDTCQLLSQSYLQQKQLKKASQVLLDCDRQSSDNGFYRFELGRLSLESGKLQVALRFFKQSLKKDPAFSQSVLALGIIYEQQGKLSQSLKLYKNYLEDHEDTVILSKLVQLLGAQDNPEVLSYAEKLSDQQPHDVQLKLRLSALYTHYDQYTKAITLLQEVLQQQPEEKGNILYFLGVLSKQVQKPQQALKYFSQILSSESSFFKASLEMAQMLADQAIADSSQHPAFISFLQKRKTMLPEDVLQLDMVQVSYFERRKEYAESIKLLENLSQHKNFQDQHRYYLASLYEKELRYDDASRLIKKILEKNPKNAHAWNFLGYSLLERNIQLDQAYEYISRAYKLSPEDGYILDSLGWYHYKKGHYGQALRYLQLAYQKVPHDFTITKHLAMVHQGMQKNQLAQQVVQNLLTFEETESKKAEIRLFLETLVPASRGPASLTP